MISSWSASGEEVFLFKSGEIGGCPSDHAGIASDGAESVRAQCHFSDCNIY